ncbi:MAG: hypothetical protein ACK4WH_10490 [Phycisphaerales bacterium]
MIVTDPRLSSAESIALDRLAAIARDSVCEREARLAAEAIFTIRRLLREAEPERDAQPSTAPTTQSPAVRQPDVPLTTDELAQLMIFLPSVRPTRFHRKHTPAYWREVLAEQRRRNPDLARALSPPSNQLRAA